MEEIHRVAADVLEQYERMSGDDRVMLANGLERIYGRPFAFTVEGLTQMKAEELKTILDIQAGIRLTRDHVPDLRQAYAELEGRELPRRVSFGRIVREE